MIRRTVKRWIANAVREYMSEDEDMAEAIAMELSTTHGFDDALARQFVVSDVAEHIDVDDIARCFDADDIAANLEISPYEIAQELDTENIAQEVRENLDYYEMSGHIHMEELARELDMDDLSSHLNYTNVAECIDINDLANKVAYKVDLDELAGYFEMDTLVDIIMDKELDAIKSELMAKVDALVNAIELAMVIHTEE